jgi:hypothetical protein
MALTIETQRSKFFNELNDEKRDEYFSIKRCKFLPTIDNLYYGVFIKGDSKENETILPLIEKLSELKIKAAATFKPVDYSHGIQLTHKSYSLYSFCLTENDLYDIFIASTIPNDNTPRICVQLRAMGLWTRGVEDILTESFNKVETVLADYGLEVEKVRENRIDYCYHTNAVSSPGKVFNEVKGRVKNLYTNLSDGNIHVELERCEDGTVLHKDYICFGRKKSNNVRARVYDKVKEVIELGYKSFFFELWYKNGLISYYDKWCFEHVMPHKKMEYLHRARLAFYIEHGENENVKAAFTAALSDKNLTNAEAKRLADGYMPKTTAVINIEYETKRKFYYYSDKFIEHFNYEPRVISPPLLRLFKIIDNKSVFLDYLTSKTLTFHHKPDSAGSYRYIAWWERLRNTKLDGIKSDDKLLRDYSHEMDKRCVMVRTINGIASAAVYDDKLDTGFIEDISDFLANITDNVAHVMVKAIGDLGEVIDDVEGDLLKYYDTKKAVKEKALKNRKRKREVDNRNVES